MRLIDADALKEKWQSDLDECLRDGVDYIDSDIEDVYADFIKDLDGEPTIYPMEHVTGGEWVQVGLELRCSKCGAFAPGSDTDFYYTRYCPECGARMENAG